MTKMVDERHTLYVGRVHPKVTDEILFELFLQVGPLLKVLLPKKERGETAHKGFAFVEFKHQESLDYAIAVLTGQSLYGQQLVIKHKNKLKESEDTNNASVDGEAGNNTYKNTRQSNSDKSRHNRAAPRQQQYNNTNVQSYHQQNNYQNSYPQHNSPANYHNNRDSGRTHKSYRSDSRYAPYNSNESNNYHKDYDRNGRNYAGGDARNVEVGSNRKKKLLSRPIQPVRKQR